MDVHVIDDPFIAVIGDVRNSRKLERRNSVQDKLNMILKEINQKFEDEIRSKFIITLGDEFQGLLSGGDNIIKIIEEIRMKIYPVEVRFGIGVGRITTAINSDMALGADGPGYYKARQAIEILKKNEKRKKTVLSDVRLEMEEEGRKETVLVNTVFELMKAVEQSWTDRQREIIWDMLSHQDGQVNTANRMGISQSSVQKTLVKGNYYVYEKSLENIERILGEFHL